jgi:hypothetical protein
MQVSSPTRTSLKITPQSRPAQDDPVEHVFSVPMVVHLLRQRDASCGKTSITFRL